MQDKLHSDSAPTPSPIESLSMTIDRFHVAERQCHRNLSVERSAPSEDLHILQVYVVTILQINSNAGATFLFYL